MTVVVSVSSNDCLLFFIVFCVNNKLNQAARLSAKWIFVQLMCAMCCLQIWEDGTSEKMCVYY